MVSLSFESKLASPRGTIWDWITSVDGISAEIWPFFQMPPGTSKIFETLPPFPANACFAATSPSLSLTTAGNFSNNPRCFR